jgi:DNA-binding transcriptional regulator LsrR (DeoR family)
MAEPYEPIAMTLREVSERLSIGKTSVGRLITSGQLRALAWWL